MGKLITKFSEFENIVYTDKTQDELKFIKFIRNEFNKYIGMHTSTYFGVTKDLNLFKSVVQNLGSPMEYETCGKLKQLVQQYNISVKQTKPGCDHDFDITGDNIDLYIEHKSVRYKKQTDGHGKLQKCFETSIIFDEICIFFELDYKNNEDDPIIKNITIGPFTSFMKVSRDIKTHQLKFAVSQNNRMQVSRENPKLFELLAENGITVDSTREDIINVYKKIINLQK